MKITATVVFNDFEGGFWGLVDDTGNKYYPVDGIPSSNRIHGLRVEADIEPANVVSMVMWGRPVVLLSISQH